MTEHVDVPEQPEREAFPEITGPIIQRAMKQGWELVEERENGAEFMTKPRKGNRWHVIFTVSLELDNRVWVHLSLSKIMTLRGGREIVQLPDWVSITEVRDDFLGPESKAIMVVAPMSEHINLEEVHHIWHCPEGDGLPDFTRGSGQI